MNFKHDFLDVIEEAKKIVESTGGTINNDWSITIGMMDYLVEDYLEEQCIIGWTVLGDTAFVNRHDERWQEFKRDVMNEIGYKTDLLAYSDSKMVSERLITEIDHLRGLIHEKTL